MGREAGEGVGGCYGGGRAGGAGFEHMFFCEVMEAETPGALPSPAITSSLAPCLAQIIHATA